MHARLSFRTYTALLALHIVLLALYTMLFGAREFSDDVVKVYVPLVNSVWFDSARGAALTQYPVGLKWLLAPAGPLALLMPKTLAIKLLLSLCNAYSLGVLLQSLRAHAARTSRARGVLFAALVVVGTVLFPVVLIPQEELIAVSVILLALRSADILRAAWLGLGVVAVKIFLLPLALIDLLATRRTGALLFKLVVFCGATAISYWQLSASRFLPGNEFGISLWSLEAVRTQVEPVSAYRLSLLLFLGACGWVMAGRCLRSRSLLAPLRQLSTTDYFWVMWIFLLAFYHISPEYYVMVLLPLLAVHGARQGISNLALAMAALLCAGWAINVLQGLERLPPLHARVAGALGSLGLTPRGAVQLSLAAFNAASALLLFRALRTGVLRS